MSKTGLKLKLVGRDGNAFAILGAAQKAMKQAGLPPEDIKKYMDEATSGNYNNLLQVTMEWFDVQ